MTRNTTRKEQLRVLFDYRCGYCGVREVDHGSELEVDHFRPKSKGGDDSQLNLIYACTAYNRAKGAYWPSPSQSNHRHLLHPLQDNLEAHLRLLDNSHLEGLI